MDIAPTAPVVSRVFSYCNAMTPPQLVYVESAGYLYFNTSKGVVFRTPSSRPETSRIRANPKYNKVKLY